MKLVHRAATFVSAGFALSAGVVGSCSFDLPELRARGDASLGGAGAGGGGLGGTWTSGGGTSSDGGTAGGAAGAAPELSGNCNCGAVTALATDDTTLYALCGAGSPANPAALALGTIPVSGDLSCSVFSSLNALTVVQNEVYAAGSLDGSGNNPNALWRLHPDLSANLITPMLHITPALAARDSILIALGFVGGDGVWAFDTQGPPCGLDASNTTCAIPLGTTGATADAVAAVGGLAFAYACYQQNKQQLFAYTIDLEASDAASLPPPPAPIYESTGPCNGGDRLGLAALGTSVFFGAGYVLVECPASLGHCDSPKYLLENGTVRLVTTDGAFTFWVAGDEIRTNASPSPHTVATSPVPITALFPSPTHIYWGAQNGQIYRVAM